MFSSFYLKCDMTKYFTPMCYKRQFYCDANFHFIMYGSHSRSLSSSTSIENMHKDNFFPLHHSLEFKKIEGKVNSKLLFENFTFHGYT